ncbi:MAG: ferrous iron transport protein B [Fibromonadales bacterium]|nr:ferrous iron transport protein B [Fibromonadales bacterium]
MLTIAVAGNANSGKSSIFNLLTDGKQKVGNWPGVTVDKKIGRIKHNAIEAQLVDLPGIYAMSAWSEDERISRDYLISCEADLLINVVDSTNLERSLFLTYLLKDMCVPVLVVLNMTDVAEKQGIKINIEEIEKQLGVPVVAASAIRKADKGKILDRVAKIAVKKTGKTPIKLPPQDENEFEALAENIYMQIENVMAKAVKKGVYAYTESDRVDKIVTNKYIGFPIFLLAMYMLFWLTIHVGGVFIDFFDIAFGAIFVDGLAIALEKAGSPEILTAILADGVGTGIQTLSTFFPIIFTLFFFIALLEGSGYMARVAFILDRLMRIIGLPGKAFIPLLIGFGCTVPALMATRCLENKRDRILSVFMVPFMSCGARLPVYILFAAAFFPVSGTNIVFALYITGIALALLTGLLLKQTVYKGTVSPFIMELPQYRKPSLKNAFINALFRLRAFVKKSGKILIPIIAVLGILNSVGVLEKAGKAVSPIFEPIGIERENWPASVALFSGLFAKEVITGSLNSLYSQNNETSDEKEFNLSESLIEALETIPENLAGLWKKLFNPIFTSLETEAEEGSESIFSNMREAFGYSKARVFSFLLFILLYVPCVAAVSAAAKEVGGVLVALQVIYSTVIGWSLATIFYQCLEGRSVFYIVAALLILFATIFAVIFYARKSERFV